MSSPITVWITSDELRQVPEVNGLELSGRTESGEHVTVMLHLED